MRNSTVLILSSTSMLKAIVSSLTIRLALSAFHIQIPPSFPSCNRSASNRHSSRFLASYTDAAMPESKQSISETYADLQKAVKLRKTHPIEWRQSQLRALSQMLEEHHHDFVKALNTDLNRSDFVSEMSEMAQLKTSVKDTINKLSEYMKHSGNVGHLMMPMAFFPATGHVVPEPLGLVLIIAPWNYPIVLALHPVIGAIAAGNAVLLKPSEISKSCSNLMARLIVKYLDQDAIRVIEGGVDETTEILKYKFDHIFYTGSTTVGKIIYQAAAKYLTPVTLELGGKSPVLIDDTANLKLAARRILFGKFVNCGQICIAPDYCLVTKNNADAFYEALMETYHQMFPGPLDTDKEFCRIINDAHTKRLVSFLEETDKDELSKRGAVLVGGKFDVEEKFVDITVFKNSHLDSKIMQDEIFGPLLPIVEVNTLDEAIEVVNNKPKPLALYLFAGEQGIIDQVTRQTSSGALSINECIMHFAVEALPFGGVGDSGMGCYHGKSTFETFSHMKTVFCQSDRNIMDPYFRYPPYDDKRKYLMRKFF